MNNFGRIKYYLNFEEGYFYYLQILRRKKDNPEAKHVKVIRNFYIEREEYYHDIENTVIGLCDFFNARAYIRINRRNYSQVALQTLRQSAEYISNQQPKAVMRSFSKAAGRFHDEDPKRWIIDIDNKDVELLRNVQNKITELQKDIQKDYKLLGTIPTPNGIHLISHPFNVREFKEEFPKVDIHKDNPTILYAKD